MRVFKEKGNLEAAEAGLSSNVVERGLKPLNMGVGQILQAVAYRLAECYPG